MALYRISYLLVISFCWFLPFSSSAGAELTTLHQSVEKALLYSPKVQAAKRNSEAIEYDLKRVRARYLPSVDLTLGYGLERYSDRITRFPGANPADTDWDPRGEARLMLTQMLYDGSETSHLASIEGARQEAANFLIEDAAHAVALNAIIAHLEVHRQRELVNLAERDYQFHLDIWQSLSEMGQAGAGNIADVTQTQARMARARSNLSSIKANLSKAVSNYLRVVGAKPGELAYGDVPSAMPRSLEEALSRAQRSNPELLALDAEISQAEAKVNLARSAYRPKINIELSSRYYDQIEGDPSWQLTNEAMVFLSWNLYSGGRDRASESAAYYRMSEAKSRRQEKLLELQETTSAAWVTYLSLEKQKEAFQEAVNFGERTLDAYLKQFSVSKRSLLDVLDAEREYFVSAAQLVMVSAEEIVTAHRILALLGELQLSSLSEDRAYPEPLKRLAHAIVFSSAGQSELLEFNAPSSNPMEVPLRASVVPAAEAKPKAIAVNSEPPAPDPEKNVIPPAARFPYSIYLGSYRNPAEVRRAISIYQQKGLSPYWAKVDLETKGVWFRLFAAYFPTKEAAQDYIESNSIPDAKPGLTKYAFYHGGFQSAQDLEEKRETLVSLGFSPYMTKGVNSESQLYTGAFSRKELAEKELSELAAGGIAAELVER